MAAWIGFTLLAVVMQSFRTAGQKQLAGKLTAQATTLVRYLFGLPFALGYFLWLRQAAGIPDFGLTQTFYVSGVLAGLAQITATVCLVKVLTKQNFAVGTALAKTEAILTAAIGSVFFSATLSIVGWMAVIVGVIGAFVASNWKVTWRDLIDNKSLSYGLAAGLGFALASLWIRDASLSLPVPRTLSAAAVLVYMVSLQTVFCLAWIAGFERAQFGLIRANLKASWFIGLTSVLGSIGWFTAMSLQNPAIVKTLGQTEFVVTLMITSLYFGETVSRRELVGIGLVALSVGLILNS
jgi:drug/metabolite transporter (DMT)-like permease